MVSVCQIFPLIYYFLLFELVSCVSKYPLLIIVSFDGFRHDFLSNKSTPNLFELSLKGSHAEYMKNIFPTKTFTNHISIGTGVYAEDHGVLANNVYYNNQSNKYGYDLFHYNKELLPIWTLNEKQSYGRHSGCSMWPGSEYEYGGVMPTFNISYDRSVAWNYRVDTIISWMTNKTTPANLVMLYFEEPDYSAHRHGIHHPKFLEQIEKCDRIMKYLLDQLKANKLDNVNLIVLSDHGMVSVKQDHIIDLNNYTNLTNIILTGTSPVLQLNIEPSVDNATRTRLINSTYLNLKKASNTTGLFECYKKDTIPEEYHYRNNSRVSDLLCVAKLHYAFQDLRDSIKYYQTKENVSVTTDSEFGVHGYSPEYKEMWPFFLAYGPNLKKNFSISPFDNIDLYPLMTHILEVPLPSSPSFHPRGVWAHVAPMFISSTSIGLSVLTIGMLNLSLIVAFAIFVLLLA